MSTAKKKRCAIVYPYPYVEQCPQLFAIIETLHQQGWLIDLFVKGETARPEGIVGMTGTRMIGDPWAWRPYGFYQFLGSSRFLKAWGVRNRIATPYSFLLAADASGLQMAQELAGSKSVPILYLSLEILVKEDISQVDRLSNSLHEFESAHLRKCELHIVQDEGRAALLANEFKIDQGQMLLMPNASRGKAASNKSGWIRRNIGIPEGKLVALYAGSLCDGMGLPGLLGSVRTWPDSWVLLLHSRYDYDSLPEKRFARSLIQELAPRDRVFFSEGRLDKKEYEQLVGDADVGIALYEPVRGAWTSLTNNRLMGLASGKTSTYLKQEVPVIVNSYTNLSTWVRREQCGVVTEDHGSFGRALAEIQAGNVRYVKQASKTFDHLLCPDDALDEFSCLLKSLLVTVR